jgi:hypothetical protein
LEDLISALEDDEVEGISLEADEAKVMKRGGVAISETQVGRLMSAIWRNSRCNTLELRRLALRPSDLEALTRGLARPKPNDTFNHNASLTRLSLSYCGLSEGAGASLGAMFARNDSLTALDISGNKMGETGMAALLNALSDNRSLTELKINNTGFVGVEIREEARKVTLRNLVTQYCDRLMFREYDRDDNDDDYEPAQHSEPEASTTEGRTSREGEGEFDFSLNYRSHLSCALLLLHARPAPARSYNAIGCFNAHRFS